MTDTSFPGGEPTGPSWGHDPSGLPGPWWIQGQLLERRIVLLRGPLDERVATEVAATLMMLDATGDDAVQLHVDSGGGSLEAAFTLIDTIELLGVPVHVTCVGRAEGAAVGVVAVAGRRFAAPHCRFRLSEPTATAAGNAAQLEHWSDHRQAQLARFVGILARCTGRPGEHIEADLSMGRWLSAAEAVSYGLVDEVWRGGKASPPPPRGPLGFRPPGG